MTGDLSILAGPNYPGDRSGEIPEHIPEDVVQVGQQPILCVDDQQAGLSPASWHTGAEVVVGQDDTDRFVLRPEDDMLVRAGDTDHPLWIERHRQVQLVL